MGLTPYPALPCKEGRQSFVRLSQEALMTSLKGKTLFISGASRGIGLAIALRAARDGANVAIAAKTAEPHPKLAGHHLHRRRRDPRRRRQGAADRSATSATRPR